RDRRHRTRQPINDRKLADDGAWAVKCEYALSAGVRKHSNFEESLLDAIAAVGGIAGPEQRLTGREPQQVRISEYLARKTRRKARQLPMTFRLTRRWIGF